MNILLCLLSDQHVPNLLSVHHYTPDQLVLIESEKARKDGLADKFLAALELGGLDYQARHHIYPLKAEDNLASVRQALQAAHGKYPNGQWIANLTGGTKPMSIATYEFFKERGGKLVYTNVSRPARLIDMNSDGTEDCGHRLGIKEFLAGYGFESRKADDKLAEAEQRARGWAQSARLLAQHACEQDILVLDDQERKRARDKGIDLPANRFTFRGDELREIWLNGAPTRKLTRYEVEFLTGGWLEVFVWDALAQHADALGIWDVRLGLEVGRCGDLSGNDFDVAFMHNHSLSMVECKSGSQDHDPGSDILYKVEAVTRQFRALRVRSYLATTGGNVLDANGSIKSSVRNRANIYNCRIVTAREIQRIAREGDPSDEIRSLLFNSKEPQR
ncbi:MAG: Card1-like endonuclease domain-containing protein [Thermoguttaceae bacterium]